MAFLRTMDYIQMRKTIPVLLKHHSMATIKKDYTSQDQARIQGASV